MKKTNKIFSVVLALMLVFAMAIPAFAADAQTGDIIVSGTDIAPMEGRTIKAYKLLDALAVDGDVNKGIVYSIPEELKSFYEVRYGTDDPLGTFLTRINSATAEQLHDFAVAALAAAKAAGVTAATATVNAEANTATFTGLPFGYYVIEDATIPAADATDTVVSALMLQTTSKNIQLKASIPTIEKKIDGTNDKDGTTTGLVDYNTAAVGETVPYVVTSVVPDMSGYDSYIFKAHDTLSKGLEFVDGSVSIVINNTTLAAEQFTVTESTNAEGEETLVIEILNFIGFKSDKGNPITIKYSAKVTEDAVKGVEGNPNTVYLEYSNNPQSTSTGHTEEDEVRTYVVDLETFKYYLNGETKTPLAGAKFELYVGNIKIADGTSDENGDVAWNWTRVVEGETIKGLKEGLTYTIKEVEAPAGYNKAEDIVFTISCTDPVAPATACTWTSNNTAVAFDTTDEIFKTEIENKTGSLLPETGGIGTTIFYVVGGILMLGAAVLLVTKKRMACEA